ncbi:MAG: AAA family ATPase [Candidatus Bathyarchaeia archaeon]|jgi:predicted ATPase
MKIVDLEIRNFKSYKELKLKFGDVNLLIGPNASGKSNLVSVFKFLNDICILGLEDAVSLQGGIDWIRNVNLSKEEPIEVKLHLTDDSLLDIPTTKDAKKSFNLGDIYYQFKISINKRTNTYQVIEESLHNSLNLFLFTKKSKEPSATAGAKIIIERKKGNRFVSKLDDPTNFLKDLERAYLIPKAPFQFEPPSPSLLKRSNQDLVILREYTSTFSSYLLYLFLRDMQFFDIDPKLARYSYSITGKNELEPDGHNLALVLSKLLKNKQRKETLQSIIRDLLPFVKGYSVKQMADKSLVTYLNEEYCAKKPIPATFTSDGTIYLTALLVALLSRRKGDFLVVVEEPERNIHPFLISKMVTILKDIAKTNGRQLVLTTHSPQFVKNMNVDEIILVTRDGCFSKAMHPSDSEEVMRFLKKDIGIDELYSENLLR